jgi:hypothetical protein
MGRQRRFGWSGGAREASRWLEVSSAVALGCLMRGGRGWRELGQTGPGCWAQRPGTTGPKWKNQRGKEPAAKIIWAENKIKK